MSRNLKVIYQNGVFRPLEPIQLKEHQFATVMLDTDDREQRDDVIGMFADDPTLIDHIIMTAMTAREHDSLRPPPV